MITFLSLLFYDKGFITWELWETWFVNIQVHVWVLVYSWLLTYSWCVIVVTAAFE